METPNVWVLSSFHPNVSKQPPPPQCLGVVLFSPRRFYRAELAATWKPRRCHVSNKAKQKIIMAGNCNAFAFTEVVGEEIRGDWSKRDGLNYLHPKWKEIRRGERIAEGSGGEREREEGRRKFLKITLYLSLFLSLTIALFLSHAISLFLSLASDRSPLLLPLYLPFSLSLHILEKKIASVTRGARRASCNPLSCLLLPLSPFISLSLSLSLSPPLPRSLSLPLLSHFLLSPFLLPPLLHSLV